jgi:hypothetical protein
MPWSSLVSCSRIAHIEEDPKMLIKVVLVLMLLLIIGGSSEKCTGFGHAQTFMYNQN